MPRWAQALLVSLAGVAVITVMALVWRAESKQKTGVESKPETVFRFTVPEKQIVHSDVLIHCSEDGAVESSKAFAKWMHLEGVPLEFPGGSLAIAKLAAVPMGGEVLPAQRSAIEILKRYSPKRIVIVAHSECIYYDTIGAWQDDLSGVEERQREDLRTARALLRVWFPKAEVRAYFAELMADNTIQFLPVEEEQKGR